MRYWLIKSEPSVFSIDDLARSPGQTTGWDGVRNYQARNFLKAMKTGDLALFYHSNAEPPAVAGTARVAREAYPDPTQFDPGSGHHDPDSPKTAPRWFQVDVALVEKFPRPVTLPEIKAAPGLKDMVLLKRGRLSVQPVAPAEWSLILRLGRRAQAAAA